MKPVRTWILICDGAHARIMHNAGPGKGLHALNGARFDQNAHPSREIMSGRPGRSFESAGTARHAMEPPGDPARAEKRHFAERLAAHLDQAAQDTAFDRLILVAAPHTLGDLRDALPARVRGLVSAELDKDLTKIPDHKLPSHLGGVIAL